MEFADLIVFSHIGLDHADRRYVFLHAVVEIIISSEDLLEVLSRPAHDNDHDTGEQKYRRQIDAGQFGAYDKGHDHSNDHGRRRSHRHSKDHLKGVLNIGDIRRQSCHKAGGREFINT